MNALLRAGRRKWPRMQWVFRYDALVVLAIVGFYGLENLRGHFAWRGAVARAEADGLPMQVDAYLPPAPAPGEMPFLESADWLDEHSKRLRPDWIDGLEVHGTKHPSTGLPKFVSHLVDPEPGLSDEAAAFRVLAKLNTRSTTAEDFAKKVRQPVLRRNYDYSETNELLGTGYPDTDPLLQVTYYLNLRAECGLVSGNTDIALRDLQSMQHLASQIGGGGTVIESTLGAAIRTAMKDTIRNGIVRGTWQAEHLRELRDMLRSETMRSSALDALNLEQSLGAFSLATARENGVISYYKIDFVPRPFFEIPVPRRFESLYQKILTTFVPDGWLKINAAHLLEYTRLYVKPDTDLTIREQKRLERYELPSDSLYRMHLISRTQPLRSVVRLEARSHLLLILIAADLYHRETSEWPTSLDALRKVDPEIERTDSFAPEHDVFYRFDKAVPEIRVWSVGDDGEDNGGREGYDEVLTLPLLLRD